VIVGSLLAATAAAAAGGGRDKPVNDAAAVPIKALRRLISCELAFLFVCVVGWDS